MKKLILIVLLIPIILSCKKNPATLNDFKKYPVKGIKYYQTGKVNPSNTRFLYYHNRIYWIDYHQDEFLFSMKIPPEPNSLIYNHNIKKGKGPDEFMMILSPKRYSNYISFLDSFKSSLFFFNNDTLFKELQLSGFAPFQIQQIIKINSNYLYSGLLDSSRFVLCDAEQKILSKYDVFPGESNELPYKTADKNMAYLNSFTSKNNAFVNIIYDSGIIEFFKIKQDSITKIKEFKYNDFEYSLIHENGATRVSSSKDNTGFIDICSDDKYVYSLHSTISWKDNEELAYFGDYILIYSWDGEPIKALELDTPLRGFSIVPGTNKFWGWGHDSKGLFFVEYNF
jgi:hypothetical protein